MNKRRVIALFVSIVIVPIIQSCFVFGVREFSAEAITNAIANAGLRVR